MHQWIQPASGTFRTDDVIFLLEDSTAPTLGVEEKERAIQAGTLHYSECITEEAPPSTAYLSFYKEAMMRSAKRLAQDVEVLAVALAGELPPSEEVILASLARAGTPIGVLLKRALERKGFVVSHYGVSIIRDKGLDLHAMNEVARRHPDVSQVVFVDGWTGKGTITRELKKSWAKWNADRASSLEFRLAVVADPCGWATHAATRTDYLIPNALLNATVSGCVSRTTSLTPNAPHGARFFEHLIPSDISQVFVDAIDSLAVVETLATRDGVHEDEHLQRKSREWFESAKIQFNAKSDNHLKPGIPETTRVLLRRKPRLVAVQNLGSPEIAHLLFLAREMNVPVEECKEMPYAAVGVIDGLNGD